MSSLADDLHNERQGHVAISDEEMEIDLITCFVAHILSEKVAWIAQAQVHIIFKKISETSVTLMVKKMTSS